ncbi:MAG TPA: DUF6438 domain-containing protein [Pyrinomonadaceae bacterium]|nr:DUF6438 domain-containing protein [Pyrinomonadaceae bacterium]
MRTFGCCLFLLMAAVCVSAQTQAGITEITLEMNPGSSPSARAFRIHLLDDGTGFYTGDANVKLMGKYRGLLAREEFQRLAQFIEEHGFFKLKTVFPSSRGSSTFGVVAPSVITTVKKASNQTSIERPIGVKINDPEPPGKQLLDIENAITSAAMQIKWEKIK